MEATYQINKEEKRVEIRFPFSPDKRTRRGLHAKEFTYNPATLTWSKEHRSNAKIEAMRIVYHFNLNQLPPNQPN